MKTFIVRYSYKDCIDSLLVVAKTTHEAEIGFYNTMRYNYEVIDIVEFKPEELKKALQKPVIALKSELIPDNVIRVDFKMKKRVA